MAQRAPANRKETGLKEQTKEGGWVDTLKVIVEALLIAAVVRTFLFQPFNIPSGSMIPTLMVGDYLFVSKYSYGYSMFSLPLCVPNPAYYFFHVSANDWLCVTPHLLPGRIFASPPKRGDVVVFKLPSDEQTDYIKRIIGLPGDKIQLRQSRLYINGELVPREPIAKYHGESFYGGEGDQPTYQETLPGGVKHTIIQLQGDKGYNSNTQVFEVPPGHYFMMGDNRDNSTDSRVPPDQRGVGYVPFENLVGRAEMIFFSVGAGEPAWEFWKWPFDARWSRMFEFVR